MKSILTILVIVFSAILANAQTSVFTYQGKLNDGVLPAQGSYELQFKIFDTQTVGTGNQIGLLTQSVTANVVNGIFTVQLDFGQIPFSTGADRFLEIAVRRNSGENFVTLEPRQPFTSSPYAIKAKLADTAATATNSTQLGGVNADQYVLTNDTRMTDARDPLAGSANYIQNTTIQQALSNFNISGEGKADIFSAGTQFNIGTDRILSNGGINNLFAGKGAGMNNSTGNGNTFVGADAGRDNTTGTFNLFIGTQAGRTNSSGQENTFAGLAAGISNTTGNSNAFFGKDAGFSNTTASFNSFFGRAAGGGNTTGANNSFFGFQSGELNSTGNNNSFFGTTSGRANTTGTFNAFFGVSAGRLNMTGNFNAMFGPEAGFNTNGNSNSFFGSAAGRSNTTGIFNAFFGADAGRNSTSSGNAFFGTFSGLNNTTGTANAFFGQAAGVTNTTGGNNTIIGNGADVGANNLQNATAIGAFTIVSQSNSVILGNNANVGIGTSTPNSKLTVVGLIESTTGGMKFPDGSIQTTAAAGGSGILNQITLQAGANFNIGGTGTANIFNAVTQYNINGSRFASIGGTNNTFLGINSGTANTGGGANTFAGKDTGSANILGGQNSLFGYKAGEANIGSFNSIFGYQAGMDNQGGSNTFLGSEAGSNNTTGERNTFVGRDAGSGNIGGENNTMVGVNTSINTNSGSFNSLFGFGSGLVNTGNLNTYIGYTAGASQSGGTNNTALGANADFGANGLSYATSIGADTVVSTSNTIQLGRTNGSDKVRIPGLGAAGATQLCRNADNEISTCSSSLRYKTNIGSFNSGLSIVKRLRPVTFNWLADDQPDLGLVAEEVAEADENLVIRNEKGEVEGVKYDRIGVVLVNAVKEQQTQIEAQAKQIEEQKKQIELLKQLICSNNKDAAVCKEENK